MNKRSFLLFLALFLLLTACTPAAQPETEPTPSPAPTAEASAPASPEASLGPELPKRDQEWVEDIEYLREEYKVRHLDPFYRCTEEEFDWKLDQLIGKVGELSDSDIFYELEAIITGTMGDTHTRLWWDGPLPLCDRIFAVNFFPQNGKLYLLNYLEGCDQFEPYLLHEIVGVNGVHSLYLMQRAAELYAPFNWHTTTEFPEYPSFFDWVGCDYKEGYTFQILNDNQEVESVEVPVITLEEGQTGSWIYPENWDSLVYVKGGDRTAYYEGPDGGCVQWCMGELWYPSTSQRYLTQAAGLMEEHPGCGKLVIDLRKCPGGRADSLPLLEVIRENAQLLEGKQIYVAIGGTTSSAAVRMIAFFKDEFGAVTVGEPTGEFSSFFSRSEERENTALVLPNSRVKVKIADRWRDSTELLQELDIAPIYEEYCDEDGRLYKWETCIQPDVYIHREIEDIRQGRDSILEWVLAQ